MFSQRRAISMTRRNERINQVKQVSGSHLLLTGSHTDIRALRATYLLYKTMDEIVGPFFNRDKAMPNIESVRP